MKASQLRDIAKNFAPDPVAYCVHYIESAAKETVERCPTRIGMSFPISDHDALWRLWNERFAERVRESLESDGFVVSIRHSPATGSVECLHVSWEEEK